MAVALHTIPGSLFAALSSGAQTGRLVLFDDGQLRFIPDDGGAAQPLGGFADATIPTPVGDLPRDLIFDDGRRFTTTDWQAFDGMLKTRRQSGLWRVIAALERPGRYLLPVAFLALIGWIAIFRFVVPFAADKAAYLVPDAMLHDMGQGAMSALDQLVFEPTALSDEDQKRVAGIFAGITQGDDRFRLHFRAGGRIGANAFALPNGWIVVTDEIVDLMPEDDLLAAILAHEMAHVTERHGAKRMLESSLLPLAIFLATGDMGEVADAAIVLPTLLLNAAYSRDAELDADRVAVRTMRARGIDPDALRRALERLIASCKSDCDGNSFLASHPANVDRFDAIRRATKN